MFFEPGFEGRIFGSGGGVAATAGVADAEELFLDGRAVVEIVFDLHVVAGAKPAVGVAVSCTPGLWYCPAGKTYSCLAFSHPTICPYKGRADRGSCLYFYLSRRHDLKGRYIAGILAELYGDQVDRLIQTPIFVRIAFLSQLRHRSPL